MILLLATLARAAEVSFTDAVERAVADSPAARITRAEAERAKADAHASAAWANPEIAVRHEPEQDGVEVSVPLDVGAMARGAVVPDAVRVADVRARAGRAAVGAAAGASWLDARRAADRASVTQAAEDLAGRLALAAKARVDAGEWSAEEGALVRADAARLLERALTARQEATNALARLAVLVDEAPGDLSLGAWPEVPAPPPLDAARLPAVIAADLDARVALGTLHAERLARIPTLRLEGGYQVANDGQGREGPTYGASIAVPLFAPGTARVRGAAARADGSAASADRAKLDAAATVEAARAEIALAEQLAAAWDIPGLDAVLDGTVRRFDAGELSLPDYIARRDLAIDAREGAIDTRWRLDRARLAAWELAGELPTEPPGHPEDPK